MHRIAVEELIAKAIDAFKSESVPPPVSVSGTSLASQEQVEPIVEVRVEDYEVPIPQGSDTMMDSNGQEVSQVTFIMVLYNCFLLYFCA